MGSFILSLGVIAIGAALGLARGGSITALRSVRPKWWLLLVGGFVLQAIAENVSFDQAASVSVIGMFLLVVGLTANASIRGALITATGVTMNLVVLVLNGTVPIRFEALEPAGLVAAGTQREQVSSVGHLLELETADTQWGSLGDTIPIGLLESVISIGDVVTFAGVIVMLANLIAAKRRVGVDVDAVFAPVLLDLEAQIEDDLVVVEAAPEPAILDIAAASPVIDISSGEAAPVQAIDLTYEPDDLWADDDSVVQILGPSSKPN